MSIGPKGGDIEPILLQSQAGVSFDFEEKEAFKMALSSFYKNRNTTRNQETSPLVTSFSRKNLTKKLAGYFDELV